ncbi:hypothetical protein [Piscinibacter sp. XHJ-5]|uniref:hypothetical protein n=1 Tax=Piscinibacter sp. XHJ-5 TaxID=3037797 RepID=UPI002453189D|nr:hypothetical protein [Piscinibacter sp. XHJ-5]
MKRLILCLLVGVGLVGCAAAPTTSPRTETDHERVAAIERAALATGVKVIWVNTPTRLVRSGS